VFQARRNTLVRATQRVPYTALVAVLLLVGGNYPNSIAAPNHNILFNFAYSPQSNCPQQKQTVLVMKKGNKPIKGSLSSIETSI
jgi:hypothetical protein